jgi:hypothetical protein
VKRVGARFALFALAGELAIDYGIVPWTEGEAVTAAAEMFRVWRAQRPTGNQEPHPSNRPRISGPSALRSPAERQVPCATHRTTI